MSAYSSKTVKDYREYTTARGIKLEIYPVPQAIIRSIVPKTPRPEVPTVVMQLPNKGTQKRAATEKDGAVWDKYQYALQQWQKEARDMQEAVTFCLALRTFKFPEVLTVSPELQGLIDAGLVAMPEDPYRRKMMWLRENVIGEHDEYEITLHIQLLGGTPEDIIKEMKESFRNTILGKKPEPVGEDAYAESASEEGDAVQ